MMHLKTILAIGLLIVATNGYAQSHMSKQDAASTVDTKFKKNLTMMGSDGGLAKIMQLRPVTFDFQGPQGTTPQMGLMTTDVVKVFPQMVSTFQTVSGTAGSPAMIDYARLTVPLIKAVQELKMQNDQLRAEFEAYKKAHP